MTDLSLAERGFQHLRDRTERARPRPIALLAVSATAGAFAAKGQHLDQVLSGTGSVVLVEGGAGMGKSRLLVEVAAMARRLSIRVGGGVAGPGEHCRPTVGADRGPVRGPFADP